MRQTDGSLLNSPPSVLAEDEIDLLQNPLEGINPDVI